MSTMETLRAGPIQVTHDDFTTGERCIVPPACDTHGAWSGATCPNVAVQWVDLSSPDLLLHAHLCKQHQKVAALTAAAPPPTGQIFTPSGWPIRDESHSVLYRSLVHPLTVVVIVLVALAAKVLGWW